VKTLEQGIENYVTPMTYPTLSEKIREDGLKIFGNVTEVYELHANTLYPALVACGHDIFKISETFDTLIANGDFYCYVTFTLNRERALPLCDNHAEFFKSLKVASGDKLGVGSFLLQPIQRLPRYKLLISEINKELIKNRQKVDIKPYVGALLKTEKNIDRMLKLYNESLRINDIASEGLVSAFSRFSHQPLIGS
jgi:RhoGEF domain